MTTKQATKVNPVQAMKVRLAIRFSIPVSEIGRARAEYEIEKQAEANGEEVLAWQ